MRARQPVLLVDGMPSVLELSGAVSEWTLLSYGVLRAPSDQLSLTMTTTTTTTTSPTTTTTLVQHSEAVEVVAYKSVVIVVVWTVDAFVVVVTVVVTGRGMVAVRRGVAMVVVQQFVGHGCAKLRLRSATERH